MTWTHVATAKALHFTFAWMLVSRVGGLGGYKGSPEKVFEGVGGGGSDAGFNAEPSEGGLAGVGQLSLLQQVQAGQDVGDVIQPPHLRLQLVRICTGALCLCKQEETHISTSARTSADS